MIPEEEFNMNFRTALLEGFHGTYETNPAKQLLVILGWPKCGFGEKETEENISKAANALRAAAYLIENGRKSL